jgi:signal transduction histidine kinase
MNNATIMLAVDNKENRRLLREWLEQFYTVAVWNSESSLDELFDVGIFDGVTLSRMGERTRVRKDAGQSEFLPILLVTNRQDVRMATHHLGHIVDEIIFNPIEKIELLARVEALLRARQFSRSLASRNQELQREIIAHEETEKALYESEARTRLLQSLTAELAAAITPDDVLNLMRNRVVSATGGRPGTIARISADGLNLEILTEKGNPAAITLPLDAALPITTVARTGQALWCESPVDCAVLFSQPEVSLNQANIHAAIFLPLVVSSKTIGAMSIYFAEPRRFSEEDRAFFLALTQQCAQALERARLYEMAHEKGISQERERLARELHDDVSQSLFMINMLGQSIPRLWEKQPERARELLDRIVQMTKAATSEMRLLLLEMRPEHLMQSSLADLFNHLINRAQGRRFMNIACHIELQESPPADVHLTLYRIVQECLNNMVKHSEATSGSISLVVEENRLTLRIQDNGRGFDMQTHNAGMGLKILRERTAMIGGALDINSVIDQGTEVVVSLDVAPTSPDEI